MELRMNRNRRPVPGMDVLYVEWLLLQNPRMPFGGRLAPLPGQDHPGLGMLSELAGGLLLIARTVGLGCGVFRAVRCYMPAGGPAPLGVPQPEEPGALKPGRRPVG